MNTYGEFEEDMYLQSRYGDDEEVCEIDDEIDDFIDHQEQFCVICSNYSASPNVKICRECIESGTDAIHFKEKQNG